MKNTEENMIAEKIRQKSKKAILSQSPNIEDMQVVKIDGNKSIEKK